MNTTLIEQLLQQAETLSKDEKLLLAEKLLAAARLASQPAPPPRVEGLHKGTAWMADDFDAPLWDNER